MEESTPPPLTGSMGMEEADSSAGMSQGECMDRIMKSLKDPTVRFLRKQMELAGCPVWARLLMAANCKNKDLAGGYSSRNGDEINQVLIHELVHAYDDCRAKNMDWKNCAHHACSEIRANHLSGDCHYKRELLRGFMTIRGHEQECVRRRDLKSVKNNSYCSEEDDIASVWDVCYEDTSPFDRAP